MDGRDESSAGPVLLVHGFGDVSASPWWETLADRLDAAGYEDGVETLNMGAIPGTTLWSPVCYARLIGRAAERLHETHGEPATVVAHSMGGLGARWYVEQRGGAPNVDSLVTLGTPHRGSRLAYLGAWTPGGQAMVPGSPFLRRLNDDPPPAGVEYTAVWSDKDGFIRPTEYAKLPFETDNVANRRVSGTNHMGLVSDPSVFRRYVDAL